MDLIVGVHLRSGGQGGSGSRGGGGTLPELCSVAAAGVGTSGFTDLRLGWDLAGEGQRGTHKPPGHSARAGEAQGGDGCCAEEADRATESA